MGLQAAIQLHMLLAGEFQALFQLLVVDMGQHIVNGGNAHLHTRIALTQQFNGILFDHQNHAPSSLSMPKGAENNRKIYSA